MERIINYYSTRKRSFLSVLFYFFLFSLLIIEGWGIPWGSVIGHYIIILFPCLFLLVSHLLGERMYVPIQLSIFLIVFLIFISLSTIHSVNVEISLNQQLFLISVLFIFIIANSLRSELLHGVSRFLFVSTFASIVFFVIIRFLSPFSTYVMLSKSSYQLLFTDATAVNHYPIGALLLLVLPVIIVSVSIERKWWKIGLSIIVFTLFLFSYLRAAYISIAISALMYVDTILHSQKKKIYTISLLLTVLISLLLLSTASNISFLNKSQHFLIERTGAPINGKTMFNLHDSFINQSIHGIIEKPYLGWGGLSFPYVSIRYAQSLRTIGMNSHSQLLDFAVEYGILASSLFMLFYVIILKKGYTKLVSGSSQEKTAYLIFLTLIIFFQLNFYYRSHYLFIFMICMGAITYESVKIIKMPLSLIVLLVMVTVLSICQIASHGLLMTGNPDASLQLNPTSESAFQESINKNLLSNNDKRLNATISRYYRFYDENRDAFLILGDVYRYTGDYAHAVAFYKHALVLSPIDYTIIQRIFETEIKYIPLTVAKNETVRMLQSNHIVERLPTDEFEILDSWCVLQDIECRR